MGIQAGILAALTVSTAVQVRANRVQNETQEKAAEFDRAGARIEAQRQNRKAIADRRVRQAELIAQSQAQNTGGNSAVSGAVGSLSSDTASEIGSANTALAVQLGQSRLLQRGTSEGVRLQNIAGGFDAIASGLSLFKPIKTTTQSGTTRTDKDFRLA